jgi:outer membrane cobalamin receptor
VATPVKPVTVAGKAPDYRRYIDRRSYSLAADLHATNGSIGDALRDVPSIDIDPQGNISVRGDSSVTILVDGQPSALFQGQSRADALRTLPADQYERVEVITNPSAAFKPDRTGGTISHFHARALSLGLTYDLGGTAKPAAKEIDFGGGGPGH